MLERDYLRRGAAEFIGTFALIFVGAGSVAFARTLTDIALAHGLVIVVFVSALGFISGGHFNPAVTLGFLVTKRIAPVLAAYGSPLGLPPLRQLMFSYRQFFAERCLS